AHPWRSAVIGAGASFIFGFNSPVKFKTAIKLGAVSGGLSNFSSQVIEIFNTNNPSIKSLSITKIAVAAYAGTISAGLTYGMPLIPAAIVSFGPSTVINKLGDVFYERWYSSTK
ncbi:hypothetical protein, partial [Legionella fairfieldensis]